jgi:hypothetical protein
MKFTQRTVNRIAMPGKIVSQGCVAMVDWLSMSMFPQVGVGGLTPRPKKLREDSTIMALPTPRVVPMIIELPIFGRM